MGLYVAEKGHVGIERDLLGGKMGRDSAVMGQVGDEMSPNGTGMIQAGTKMGSVEAGMGKIGAESRAKLKVMFLI